MKQLRFVPESDDNIIHSGTVVILDNGVIEQEIEISDWNHWEEIMGFIFFRCSGYFELDEIEDLSCNEVRLLEDTNEEDNL